MKHLPFPFMAIVFSACIFAACVEADAQNLEKMAAGEVLVLKSNSKGPGGTVRVQAVARASARAVWDVIVSCRASFVFVDGLQSCNVIEDSGARALVHQVTKQGWPAPTMDLIYESLREPVESINFKLVQGNLKEMQGSWTISDHPVGVLLDYEIRVKPETAVPDFMVSSSLKKSAPDMVACIRGLSAGSGSGELRKRDLKRCPGDTKGFHNSDADTTSIP